jgi:hypothetical protein
MLDYYPHMLLHLRKGEGSQVFLLTPDLGKKNENGRKEGSIQNINGKISSIFKKIIQRGQE